MFKDPVANTEHRFKHRSAAPHVIHTYLDFSEKHTTIRVITGLSSAALLHTCHAHLQIFFSSQTGTANKNQAHHNLSVQILVKNIIKEERQECSDL